MCWRMVLELLSVEVFCHHFGRCLQKMYNVLFVLNRLIGNLQFKSKHV